MISIKRIYEEPSADEGFRILVDRLWPRGLSKEKARIDLWLREISPSNELRKWYDHDIEKWEQFLAKYSAELEDRKELLQQLKELEKIHSHVTFLFSAKNETHNNAVALKSFIEE